MTNGQLYTGYKYLSTKAQGNKFFKCEWILISKALDSLTWRVIQSLGLLHCMQLHTQAHTHPASEGLFNTKGAAATEAVLPIKYNAWDILYIVVGYS